MTELKPDNLELIRRDIISLAQAIKHLNDYGARLASVESVCINILAPSPNESRAQEDLASLSAVRPKHGAIACIIADWDDNWHFVFQFRFVSGYWTGDGFDLREGEPGYEALLKALELAKVDKSVCDLSAPEKASTVPTRRIIFPKAEKAVENPPNK